jgi:hypothetical protein
MRVVLTVSTVQVTQCARLLIEYMLENVFLMTPFLAEVVEAVEAFKVVKEI